MQNMTLGSLAFLCGPAPASSYGVWLGIPVQGFDAADYRIVNYPIPGQDNARVSSAFYDARTITLQGIINGATPTDYQNNRIALAQACAINRDQYGYPSLTKLSFTTLDGNSYFIYVQPKKPVFDMTYLTWTKYQLTLLAPDPRLYGVNQATSGSVGTIVGGGFVLPVILPITSSAASGGTGAVTNSGTTDSHPIITFTGPLTSPYLHNLTTGYAFQLDYTIPGGSSVVVDMYNKTVLLNGSTNLIAVVDSLSTWFTITPGANSFTLSTSSGSDTGNVQISCYSAWAGL